MIRRLTALWYSLLFAAFLVSCAGGARPAPVSTIQSDSAIVRGTLDNGFEYLILPNSEPRNLISFRLVVRAGSIHEDDDQLGIAHLVEHMAFNGSTHFTKNSLIDYFELIGMQFGPKVNAYSSFEETVYKLEIPANEPAILEQTLLVLQDWAMGLTFDPEELDKERGVVIEEWRVGRGARARVFDTHLPVLLANSRYSRRLPIGDPTIISTISRDRVVDFYRRWYRADRMALVVSGVIDTAEIRGHIKRFFSPVPAEGANPPDPSPGDMTYDSLNVSVASDPELPYAMVELLGARSVEPITSVAHLRQFLVNGLAITILDKRLAERTLEGEPPFLASIAGFKSIAHGMENPWMAVIPAEGALERGFGALLETWQLLALHGATEAELTAEKAVIRNQVEQDWLNRDKQRSADLADSMVESWLSRSVHFSLDTERELLDQLLPTISLDEINAVLRGFITHDRAALLVSVPASASAVPDAAAWGSMFRNFRLSEESTARRATDLDRPLWPPADFQGSDGGIVKRQRLLDRGIERWILSNGASVVLYPTDYKNDEVLFHAFGTGGVSLFDNKEHPSALVSIMLQARSGLNGFGPVDLHRKLSGKTVSISPWATENGHGFNGFSSVRDLETLFQLISLHFTAPEASEAAWGSLMSTLSTVAANRLTDPNQLFDDLKNRVVSGAHPRMRPLSPELIAEMDFKEAKRVYKELFGGVSGFTFVFTGSLDPAVLEGFVVRYLSTLPAGGPARLAVDRGLRFPTGIVRDSIRAGLEPRSAVFLTWGGLTAEGELAWRDIEFLATLLEIRLREIIREDMSGTYSVRVDTSHSPSPTDTWQIFVEFSCEPGREQELTQAVLREIEWVKNGGADDTYVHKLREGHVQSVETAMRTNGFWLEAIAVTLQRGRSLRDIEALPRFADQLSPRYLARLARRYLSSDNYVEVVLYPLTP